MCGYCSSLATVLIALMALYKHTFEDYWHHLFYSKYLLYQELSEAV